MPDDNADSVGFDPCRGEAWVGVGAVAQAWKMRYLTGPRRFLRERTGNVTAVFLWGRVIP